MQRRYQTTRLAQKNRTDSWFAAGLSLVVCFLFYLSTKAGQRHFDYTYRIAQALLSGHVVGSQAAWLNEMVPAGKQYSVFPLGAVLGTIPTVIMQKMHLFNSWPAGQETGVAVACVYFFYAVTHVTEMCLSLRALLALFPIFGTWAWCNLGFAGAWQMALSFVILGQTGLPLLHPRASESAPGRTVVRGPSPPHCDEKSNILNGMGV